MTKTRHPDLRNADNKTFIKQFAGVYLFLLLYSFLVVRRGRIPVVDDVMYVFHCVDFSMGFCTRFLPGAIYNLFVNTPTEFSATVFEVALLLLFFAGLSLLLLRYYHTVPEEQKKSCFILLAFYVTGTATFAPFSLNLGMLDVWWIVFSLLYILALQTKYVKWFACPSLMFGVTLVHYGAIITYIPFLALLTLYEFAKEEEKREKTKKFLLFFLCAAVALGGFFCFLANDKNNTVYSMREFDEILRSRGADSTIYYDASLYYNSENSGGDYLAMVDDAEMFDYYPDISLLPQTGQLNGLAKIINGLLLQVETHIFLFDAYDTSERILIEPLVLTVLLLPLLYAFYRLTARRFFSEKTNKPLRFVFFCIFFIYPLASLGSLLISTDSVRWTAQGFLCLFTTWLYIMRKEKDGWNEALTPFGGIHPLLCAFYIILYTVTMFDPYV